MTLGIPTPSFFGELLQMIHAGSYRLLAAWLWCCFACALAGCGRTSGEGAEGTIVIEYWHQPMVSVVPGKEDM